jgi:hypothetical protein
MSREPGDAELVAAVDELHVIHDMPLHVIANLAGFSQPVLARARTKGRMSPKFRRCLGSAVARIKAVLAENPTADTRNADWFREQFAKQRGGRLETIPQVNGALFIREFCKLAGVLPEEFEASAQLAPQLINAPIVTQDGQTWIRWWATAKESVLEHKPFAEFIALHGGDRHKALTLLANEAFALILADVGRERVFALMQSLLRSGELKAGSAAATGKN